MKRKLLILAALVAMAAADGFAQEPKVYNWFRIAHAGNWSRILLDQYVGVESVVIRNYDAKDFFGKLVKVGEPYTAVLSFDDRDKMVKNTVSRFLPSFWVLSEFFITAVPPYFLLL